MMRAGCALLKRDEMRAICSVLKSENPAVALPASDSNLHEIRLAGERLGDSVL